MGVCGGACAHDRAEEDPFRMSHECANGRGSVCMPHIYTRRRIKFTSAIQPTMAHEEERKFTSFIQPAMAYENGSVFMSGPLQQWPISMNKQISGPCATSDNAWHNEHPQKAAHAPAEDHESKGSQRHNVAHHPQHERRKACICASAWAH